VSETVPALPGLCWPVDWGCVPDDELAEIDEKVKARAEALAAQTLRALTAYQVGGCPIWVRPCAAGCGPAGSFIAAPLLGGNAGALGAPVGPWWPHIENGSWVNTWCGCGAQGCSCTTVPEVVLPGPVGGIEKVLIDGAELDPAAYRVDQGNRLVRTDGGTWPRCQDMTAAPDADGAFAVLYVHGYPVDGLGSWVAGVLAHEFALACTGGKCKLPAGVTSIARQGVTLDIPTGLFESGLTGITEVDAWVRAWNPYHLITPPTVWAPGMPESRARTTTWSKVVGP
jgi:hypothetical protein